MWRRERGEDGEARRGWTWSTREGERERDPRKANEGPNEGPHGQIERVEKKLETSKRPCVLAPDRPHGDDAPAKMDAKWS